MNFQTMNKQRLYVLIAAAVGIISLFLPWVKVTIFFASATASAMNGSTGYFLFLLFAVCGVMVLLGNHTANIDKGKWVVLLICGIIAVLWILLTWVGASNSAYGGSSLAFGFYISLLSAVGVVVAAFMFRSADHNIKDGFNSLKGDIQSRMNSTSSTSTNTGTSSSNTPPNVPYDTSKGGASMGEPGNTPPPL